MITPANATPTTLYFTSFDTEPDNDKLLIYDFSGMALLAEISGDYTQGILPEPVTSPSGKFFIVFVSNNAISAQGFEAYYAPEFVGVDEMPTENETLLVYPNPASDQLNIKLSGQESGVTQLSIYNLAGSKVYEQSVTTNESIQRFRLNIADYQAGLYVVIVRNGNNFYRKELAIY